MKGFTKVGVYKNLRFKHEFEDLKLEVCEINPKYIHNLTGKIFNTIDEINSYIDEITSKRPRFLVLSKTLEDKELKVIYGDDVKVLNNKPSEIKRFTVESQYDYTLSDEYFDTYKTFNPESEVRNYLAEDFGLFTGNYDLVGDYEEWRFI